jgi:hypothetical protein
MGGTMIPNLEDSPSFKRIDQIKAQGLEAENRRLRQELL